MFREGKIDEDTVDCPRFVAFKGASREDSSSSFNLGQLTKRIHGESDEFVEEEARQAQRKDRRRRAPFYLESPIGFTFTWNRPLCAVLMLLGGGGGGAEKTWSALTLFAYSFNLFRWWSSCPAIRAGADDEREMENVTKHRERSSLLLSLLCDFCVFILSAVSRFWNFARPSLGLSSSMFATDFSWQLVVLPGSPIRVFGFLPASFRLVSSLDDTRRPEIDTQSTTASDSRFVEKWDKKKRKDAEQVDSIFPSSQLIDGRDCLSATAFLFWSCGQHHSSYRVS